MIRRSTCWRLAALLVVPSLLGAACSDDDDGGGDDNGGEEAAGEEGGGGGGLLARGPGRGTLRCGNETVPGFGLVDEAGDYAGFDIEFRKAAAAAVLGDLEAVEYVSLDAETRFTVAGRRHRRADPQHHLHRTRDGTERSRFPTTTFYDGQDDGAGRLGLRVDRRHGRHHHLRAVGHDHRAQPGHRCRGGGIDYEPLTFDGADEDLCDALIAGQCQGWTSDKSQLAGVRSAFPDSEGGPEGLTILDETFSKEPLGPVVLDGDDEWAAAVDWAVIATIQAEEFGNTTANVEDMTSSENLDILRFLASRSPARTPRQRRRRSIPAWASMPTSR